MQSYAKNGNEGNMPAFGGVGGSAKSKKKFFFFLHLSFMVPTSNIGLRLSEDPSYTWQQCIWHLLLAWEQWWCTKSPSYRAYQIFSWKDILINSFCCWQTKISRFKENKTRNHNFPLSTYESKYLSDFFSDCLTMVFLHHLDTIIWLWRWDNWPLRGSNKTETWS